MLKVYLRPFDIGSPCYPAYIRTICRSPTLLAFTTAIHLLHWLSDAGQQPGVTAQSTYFRVRGGRPRDRDFDSRPGQEIFQASRRFRPAPRPTQLLIQWTPETPSTRRGVTLTTRLHPALRSHMRITSPLSHTPTMPRAATSPSHNDRITTIVPRFFNKMAVHHVSIQVCAC